MPYTWQKTIAKDVKIEAIDISSITSVADSILLANCPANHSTVRSAHHTGRNVNYSDYSDYGDYGDYGNYSDNSHCSADNSSNYGSDYGGNYGSNYSDCGHYSSTCSTMNNK